MKQNKSNRTDPSDRRARPDELRREGGLGKPDIYPPEEFAGIGDSGEFPEWRENERQPNEPVKHEDDANEQDNSR